MITVSSLVDYLFVILSTSSMIGFGYLYNKDHDKRKLMFLLAFSLICLNHLSNIVLWWDNDIVAQNMNDWSPFPMLCAFLIASLCSMCKHKEFERAFKVYLIAFCTSIVLIFIPIPLNFITSIIVPALSFSIVVTASISVSINRQLPNALFLFSILSLVVEEIIRNTVNTSLPFQIFFYVSSHVFLFLVFITSRNRKSNDISPFFSLQKKLEVTQKELETSKERLVKVENIFIASPHPIFVIDVTGKIVEFNYSTEKLYGYKKQDFIGKNHLQIIAKKDRVKIQQRLEKLCKEKPIITNFEFTAVNLNGTEFPAEFSASYLLDDQGHLIGYVIITEDITQRKFMENQLRRHSEELGKLVEERTKALKESQEKLVKTERLAAIGQAATMVGHDLRNPLQAISNGAYILKKAISKNEVPEDLTKTINCINNSIEYADNIVKNLQSFTKIKQPVFEATDINMLLERVFSLVQKPENVEIEFESKKMPKIMLDREMILRVFVNLVSNAFQAMKDKGGILKVKTKTHGDYIDFIFIDTGAGISEETKKKLFTAFFTTKAQGMGVGLAVCKRVIDLHKGTIKVESTEGKGATFIVTLPKNLKFKSIK